MTYIILKIYYTLTERLPCRQLHTCTGVAGAFGLSK